jgi:hypothetical protein
MMHYEMQSNLDDALVVLKGQCHENFDFRFSTWISFPQAVSTTPAELVAKFAADVVDTGGAP